MWRGSLPSAVGRNSREAAALWLGPAGKRARVAHGNACAPRPCRRGNHTQTARGTTRWRAHWRLGGGSTVARCCRRSRGGHKGGARQGGESRVASERRADGEAVQTASSGGRVAPLVVDERGEVLQLKGDQWGEEAAVDWGMEQLGGRSPEGGERRQRSDGVRRGGGAPVGRLARRW
jgi:hypothetical protein